MKNNIGDGKEQEQWRSMEENEERFFSLWCNSEDRKDVLILWNRSFQGDPIFNHATRVLCNKNDAKNLVKHVSHKFRSKGVQPCFYVSPLTRPVELGELLVSDGYHVFDQMKIMKFQGGAHATNREITIEKTDSSSIARWAEIYMVSFGISARWREEVLKRCSMLAADPHIALYLALYDSQEAGCLALYSDKNVGGIYCVGTVPKWRRRGVASALLSRAAHKSGLLGNKILCLQTLAQDKLEDFYMSNGFRTVLTRSIYLQG